MKPKFKNIRAWEQAQLLMQPAFIRTLDHIRRHLDRSGWQGTYEEVELPYPGYQLHLTLGERSQVIDIWELCFQICFQDYPMTHTATTAVEVEIDTTLLDETGEVNWRRLDEKAKQLVENIFANLPDNS